MKKQKDLMMSKTPNVSQQRRKAQLMLLAGVVIIAGALSGGYWFLYGSHFVATDNAYAAVEITQVTPSIGGTVGEVLVKDTQMVKKGDLLVRIDPTDAQLAKAQADAELENTIRRVKGYFTTDSNLHSQIQAREADELRAAAQLAVAQADFSRASIDLKRRKALVADGAVSGDELTQAQNAWDSAKARLAAEQAAASQAKANRASALSARETNAVRISDTTVDNHPEVALARARRDQAAVDLARTEIRAPVEGIIAKRQVEPGQRVQAGMPLMTVVPVHEMYVNANYKEVQLTNVRVGQPVELHADLYGSSVTYHGVVEGFSGGSGSAFSAIPAQNATGNWIKVVQRLPVRIKLDPIELDKHPLKVGLSMHAEIDTRGR
ncbi:HlyD family secretion protein [Klebsiella sp. RHBSTW-00215]|uniref:HlyD family secretion protein n=1 Tax=Klebsiella sp. RHBSTW-00215 TaxID=2742640 RepID=UPI001C70FB1C|nr:HlyD family secretion protein [Klebsiella sp. RHBSTW-00215]